MGAGPLRRSGSEKWPKRWNLDHGLGTLSSDILGLGTLNPLASLNPTFRLGENPKP